MNRNAAALAGIFLAATASALSAQVLTPAVVPQGTVVALAPEGILTATATDTTKAEPGIFNPSPLGTFIETTADKRTVRYLNGYDVSYEIDGRWVPTRGYITDGLDQPKIYPVRNVDALWPLEVGKSTTFNVEGARAITARVVRTEVIRVPAGNFFTYVIERRDRDLAAGPDNLATYWYAPSVGTVVKFAEQVNRAGRPRPAYEVVSIVLPQPRTGTVPVATPAGDSADARAQYCREHTTSIRLADGREMLVNCFTYTQARILDYTSWLQARGPSLSSR
jgi:hypothetical protein